MDPEAGKLRYFTQEANLKQSLKQKQLAALNVSLMTGLDELEPSDKASRNPSVRLRNKPSVIMMMVMITIPF
jgi:hypothetical protein